ncbi:MAG: methionyl-tRNA formyltransferase, partial [Acidimicrobiales bacterium]
VVEVAPESRLRVAYFGTPGFAAVAMRELLEADVEPVVVVTRPDAPTGRGLEVQPSPVHEVAKAAGIPVLTPARPRGRAFLDELVAFDLDAIVLVAYGQILPDEVLALPRLGAINLHPSLLPRWRGAAPVERAILAGDEVTGVCLMQVVAELDAGPVYRRVATPVGPAESAAELRARLAALGRDLLVGALAGGLGVPRPQSGVATYAPRIDPSELHLDWEQPAVQLARVVRVGRAWTTVGGRRLLVLAATADQLPAAGPPGSLDGTWVATGAGRLRLLRVQPEGRAALDAEDWLRGVRHVRVLRT